MLKLHNRNGLLVTTVRLDYPLSSRAPAQVCFAWKGTWWVFLSSTIHTFVICQHLQQLLQMQVFIFAVRKCIKNLTCLILLQLTTWRYFHLNTTWFTFWSSPPPIPKYQQHKEELKKPFFRGSSRTEINPCLRLCSSGSKMSLQWKITSGQLL